MARGGLAVARALLVASPCLAVQAMHQAERDRAGQLRQTIRAAGGGAAMLGAAVGHMGGHPTLRTVAVAGVALATWHSPQDLSLLAVLAAEAV